MEQLVNRLEAVTARLESVAARGGSGPASGEAECDLDHVAPSVAAFDVIVSGSLAKFLASSDKIGGDVKTQGDMVKAGFSAQRDFLVKVSKCKEPSKDALQSVLKPTADKISDIQSFREKHRSSPFFNHLSAISESIPALGWVMVSPAPGPYIREMCDAGQFYTNRVLKDFKEKDIVHGDWVKAWLATLTELQAYVKEYYTTGIQWNKQGVDVSAIAGKPSLGAKPSHGGGAPPPPPPGPPPPPLPVDVAPAAPSEGSDESRNALFAELNKGEDITKSLKKVTDDMKTHKNPALRFNAPQPFKPTTSPKPSTTKAVTPAKQAQQPAKPPKCALEGKKWNVEYQQGNKNLVIDETEMKHTVYIYKCDNCTIQVKGKVNAITLDSCKKTAVVFDEAISSCDFVNCQSVQAQVIHRVPTVSVDKTDGCMIYLSKESLTTQIVTAKSSEMNVLIPDDSGEYKEYPIPEQFRTNWNGKQLVTEMTDIKVG